MPSPTSPPLAKAPEISHNHPWLGLSSFTKETADYFFGRDSEIRELHKRILHNPLTILYGQSGLGKTSLLGAGLIPRLEADTRRPHSAIIVRLRYEDDDPPLLTQTRIALAEATGLSSFTDAPPEEPLWESLHRLPLALDSVKPVPVLLFDQFEEIFTLGQLSNRRKEEARQWLVQVADLIENRAPASIEERLRENRRLTSEYDFSPSPLRILLSLREDYLSHLEQWKPVLPSLMENRMPLHLLDGPRALDAVTGPANLGDSSLVTEKGAARIVRIAADVNKDTPLHTITAVPPILSLLCEQLNITRLKQNDPRIKASFVSRESEKILQDFYEDSFTQFPKKQQKAIRTLIEDKLLTTTGHRAPFAWDDAEAFLKKQKLSDPAGVFQNLVARRLITIEERGQHPRLEITHDVLTPIIARSRKGRHDRMDVRKKIRTSAYVLLPLLAIAGFIWFSSTQSLKNKLLREQTEQDRLIAETARSEQEKQKKLLWQASEADCEAGIRARNDRRFDEAFAYFERGLRYAPENLRNERQGFNTSFFSTQPYSRNFNRNAKESLNTLAFSQYRSSVTVSSTDSSLHFLDSKSKEFGKLKSRGIITTFAFSPDGSHIAVGYPDKTFRLFDSQSDEIWRSNISGRAISTLVFSPDGLKIAAGSDDGFLRLFDLQDKEIWNLKIDGRIFTLGIYPDSSIIAVGSGSRNLHLFDLNRKHLWSIRFEGHVKTLAFSPDGSRIAAGSWDNSLRIFDLKGKELSEFLFEDKVNTLAFSPDGSRIAAGSDDGFLRIFDLHSKELFNYNFKRPVSTLAFSADGSTIAAASPNGPFRFFDSPSREFWEIGFESRVTAFALTQNGTAVATGLSLRLLDFQGKEIWKRDFERSISTFTISQDGSIIAAAFPSIYSRIPGESKKPSLCVFDSQSEEFWKEKFESNITALAMSLDGSTIAAGTRDKYLHIYTSRGKELWRGEFKSHITSLAISTDGSIIAVGFFDKTLHLLNSQGQELGMLEFKKLITTLTFAPDSSTIAAGFNDDTLGLLTLQGEEQWNHDFGSPVDNLVFSPDNSKIAASSRGKSIRLLNSQNKELWNFDFDSNVNSIAFTPNSSIIAASSMGNSLRLSDLTHLELPSPENRSLLAAWITLQSPSTFDTNGRLTLADSKKINAAHQTVIEAIESDQDTPLHRLLRWKFTDPLHQTLSSSSEILLRDFISQKLRTSTNEANILSAHSRAIWHPLAPISLASLERNKENDLRKKFLCQLTLKRLKAADPKIWGNERLAEDAAFAAKVMEKLGYPELAKEATDFISSLQSPDKDE